MLANARATRRCPRVARTCFAAALALLFDLENNVGSSKAAATAGFAEGKTATSCVGVSPHLRYLRFFLMGLEIWKHIVIQFRSKAFFFEKYLFLNLNRRYFHRGSLFQETGIWNFCFINPGCGAATYEPELPAVEISC